MGTTDEHARKTYSVTTQSIEMLQLAQNDLGELMRMAGHDDHLKL